MSKKMTDRLQVLITDEQREKLDALRDGTSVGPFVREALDEYLEHPEVKKVWRKALDTPWKRS